MANISIRYPSGAPVTEYANLAAFPTTAATGSLAYAIDTGILYLFNVSSWVVVGGPDAVLTVGTLDSQTPSANGAVITPGVLTLQSASSTTPGILKLGGDLLTTARVKYVRANGNDSTGDGSIDKPFLTLDAAETSITDASDSKFYIIDIGPGTYTPQTGFLKKNNISWRGAGRRTTRIFCTGVSAAGGLKINATTPNGFVLFQHLQIQQGLNGLNVNQTASGGVLVMVDDCTLRNPNSIIGAVYDGLNIEVHNSEIIGSTAMHGGFLLSFASYFGGGITGDATGVNNPNVPVIANGDTTLGLNTIHFAGGTAGINPGMRITGAGIPVGAMVEAPVDPNDITITENATATAAGVPLTFTANVSATIEVLSGTVTGVYLSQLSTGVIAAYNQSDISLTDAGTSINVTPDALRDSTLITQDPGTILNRLTGSFAVAFTPAVSGNWLTQPTYVEEALNKLAADKVTGPSVAPVDGALAIFDTTSGRLLKTLPIMSDTGTWGSPAIFPPTVAGSGTPTNFTIASGANENGDMGNLYLEGGNIITGGTINFGSGFNTGANATFQVWSQAIFQDLPGTNSVAIRAPVAVSASYLLNLPTAQGSGTLNNDGSGNLSWITAQDPVTLTAVGSSPSANGASLSGQALTLQPADGTNPGVLTAGTQNIGGSKTFLAAPSAVEGTRSERYGAGSSANKVDSTAIGNAASINGTTAKGTAIGSASTVEADSGTSIGYDSHSYQNGTAIGRGASAGDATNQGATAIGYGSMATKIRSLANGTLSVAAADAATAVGNSANAGHQAAICIGFNATSTAANQLILGGISSRSIKNVYIGAGVTDPTPDASVTLQLTGGSGADIVGSNLIIAPGVSTGAGAPSTIAFQTTTVAGSSSTPQTLTTRLTISSTAITSTLPLTLPAGTAAAYSVSAEQNLGTLTWTSAVDPSGTINKKYHWTQTGKLVTLWCKIDASVAGTAVSAVDFALPGDLPAPSIFASQPASTVIAYGSGNLSTTANSALNGASDSKLYLDGGSVARVTIETTVAVAGAFAWSTLSYLTA